MTRLTGKDIPNSLPESEEEMEARASGEWEEKQDKKPRNSDAYDITELRGISSFAEAQRLATEKFGTIDDASTEIGSGFTVVNNKEKDRLLGVAFVILSMDFNIGDMGGFVSFVAVTEDNRKVIVNDGSSGIYAQLEEWNLRTNKGGGLFVKGGLRKSEYPNPNGEGQSTTYYLNV